MEDGGSIMGHALSILKAGRSIRIRLQGRSAADIDAQCAGCKQAKNYTAAQASFDQWVHARGVQISDAAQAQACHGEFNAVGPLAVKEVGDEHSKIVDEIDLLLERHDNSYLGMERLDMEPTVMRYASEAKYSETYQKSHPNSITNPNYDLSPASKLKYCKHLLIMWSHYQWENDGDADSVFVSLDVHEYLPRLHTYIEKEVATRCDNGDSGPKCDQNPITDILDTCLRRLNNNGTVDGLLRTAALGFLRSGGNRSGKELGGMLEQECVLKRVPVDDNCPGWPMCHTTSQRAYKGRRSDRKGSLRLCGGTGTVCPFAIAAITELKMWAIEHKDSHPKSDCLGKLFKVPLKDDAEWSFLKQSNKPMFKDQAYSESTPGRWAGNDLKDLYRQWDANKLGVAFDTAFPTDPNTGHNRANLTTSYGYRKAMELKLRKFGCPPATRDLLGGRVVKNGADNKADYDTIDSDKLLRGALVLNNPRLLQHFNALLPPYPGPQVMEGIYKHHLSFDINGYSKFVDLFKIMYPHPGARSVYVQSQL
jgi:hypothetical protein